MLTLESDAVKWVESGSPPEMVILIGDVVMMRPDEVVRAITWRTPERTPELNVVVT
jgi:hypothetical protein